MLQRVMNRTNVIWSFESSSLSDELIQKIGNSEVDAVRVVGRVDGFKRLLAKTDSIKSEVEDQDKIIPVIVDMSKKSRCKVGQKVESQEVLFDQKFEISREGKAGALIFESGEWESFFKVGAPVYIGRGTATLVPYEVTPQLVKVQVSQGGRIRSGMEAYCPETEPPAQFGDLSPDELQAWVDHKVDCIVTPGFDQAEDLSKLKKDLRSRSKSPPWMILKVNSEKVFHNLKALLPYVHGVLISRLDLAMDMDPARVPMVTKEVIQLCNARGKLVLVASDIFASMRHNATPTRAEVSDIANAAMDGADGVVLSEDLAFGDYADRGLTLAKKTINDIERRPQFKDSNWNKRTPEITHTLAAITFSAYRTAHRNRAKAIVCLTNAGNTALLLASFRTNIPIIAVTLSSEVLRRLSLIRGVYGMMLEGAPNIDEVLPLVNDKIVHNTWLSAGDKIVFVSVSLSSVGEKASNLFTVQTLK